MASPTWVMSDVLIRYRQRRRPGRSSSAGGEARSRRGSSGLAVALRDREGEVEGLTAVKPGVTGGFVPLVQVGGGDLVAAADALGHVVTGELDVDAARVGAEVSVHVEEPVQLVEHVVEVAGLVTARGFEGVAVHRIADPGDRGSVGGDGADARPQHLPDPGFAQSCEQFEAARLA